MPIWYDIVFFKAAQDTVRRLADGTYNVIKAPGRTIQAINARPPADQSAEVAALTQQNATLVAQVAQLEADLAACLAGNPPDPPALPTIANMTATPANLPAGGGTVVIDATVTGADSLTLDGAPVVLPKVVVV